ncbi:hypothetical protein BRADI_1g65961v3 [Brachypodium distachyon]|uniref:Uncharacterized protein n=2 Tax=Brachypodium distachyon TaxID=15368 RepID=A0A2K2DTL0_BRADI|nr:hypothetical protein BRADI_1g65961v3 [Brachypodium distachyon]
MLAREELRGEREQVRLSNDGYAHDLTDLLAPAPSAAVEEGVQVGHQVDDLLAFGRLLRPPSAAAAEGIQVGVHNDCIPALFGSAPFAVLSEGIQVAHHLDHTAYILSPATSTAGSSSVLIGESLNRLVNATSAAAHGIQAGLPADGKLQTAEHLLLDLDLDRILGQASEDRPRLLALLGRSSLARQYIVSDMCFCGQFDNLAAMTIPCLLLMSPTGTILLPWHLGAWSGGLLSRGLPCAPAAPGAGPSHSSLLTVQSDILMYMEEFLSPKEGLSLRLSCKGMLASLPWVLDCSLTPLLLLILPSATPCLGLYSPLAGEIFALESTTGRGYKQITLFSSHQEWVLLKIDDQLCLVNLLNNVKKVIPPPSRARHYTLMDLLVNEQGVHIFGISTPGRRNAIIGEYTVGGWAEQSYASNASFLLSDHSKPVKIRASCYCLANDGSIGVYTRGSWDIVKMPDKRVFLHSSGYLVPWGKNCVLLWFPTKERPSSLGLIPCGGDGLMSPIFRGAVYSLGLNRQCLSKEQLMVSRTKLLCRCFRRPLASRKAAL